jgi:hypothetical protein
MRTPLIRQSYQHDLDSVLARLDALNKVGVSMWRYDTAHPQLTFRCGCPVAGRRSPRFAMIKC